MRSGFREKNVHLRLGFDFGEEIHQSRILGEWSNMIGYDKGSSPTTVYTTAKTFSGGESQA